MLQYLRPYCKNWVIKPWLQSSVSGFALPRLRLKDLIIGTRGLRGKLALVNALTSDWPISAALACCAGPTLTPSSLLAVACLLKNWAQKSSLCLHRIGFLSLISRDSIESAANVALRGYGSPPSIPFIMEFLAMRLNVGNASAQRTHIYRLTEVDARIRVFWHNDCRDEMDTNNVDDWLPSFIG